MTDRIKPVVADDGSVPDPEDFSDLGFDVERHREALLAFAALGLDAASLRPALRARDLMFVRFPSGPFRIARTDDPEVLREAEAHHGCAAFETIHRADTPEAAERVRADVERYFRRHFPGRTVAEPAAGFSEPLPPGRAVVVVCYLPAQ